ncbi:DUF835 domain-containing protein [Candidatus Poribacteria bacterium]
MLSLIPGLSYFFLGIYVLRKDRRELPNLVFAVFAFSLAIWCIFEVGHRLTDNTTVAHLCIRGGGVGWCYMTSFWVHFLLIFARREKYLKSKLTYIVLYGPSSAILSLFLTTDMIYKQEPVRMYFGYTSLPGEYIWIYTLNYMLLYLFGVYILLEVVRKGIKLERKQAKPVLFGTTAFLVLGTATNVILPLSGMSAPELATTLSMVWGASVFYAVIKHRLFIVKPSIEEHMETPERYILESGMGYFVNEERPGTGYEVFLDRITHGDPGLCISKLAPDKIRERYNLVKTPILWLTFKNVEKSISPKNVDGLTSVISDFIRKTQKSLVFLDCFDQIKFAIGFDRALSALRDFVRLCSENNSTILMSIPPNMFEVEQLAAIAGELNQEIRE